VSPLDVAVVSPSDVIRAGLVRLVANLPGLHVSLELASVARLLALTTGPPLAIVDITGLRRPSVHEHLWSVLPRQTRVVLVCRPDVRWAALRLRPLPAAMSAVLSDCGLAPELTDTDAGYELFRKQS